MRAYLSIYCACLILNFFCAAPSTLLRMMTGLHGHTRLHPLLLRGRRVGGCARVVDMAPVTCLGVGGACGCHCFDRGSWLLAAPLRPRLEAAVCGGRVRHAKATVSVLSSAAGRCGQARLSRHAGDGGGGYRVRIPTLTCTLYVPLGNTGGKARAEHVCSRARGATIRVASRQRSARSQTATNTRKTGLIPTTHAVAAGSTLAPSLCQVRSRPGARGWAAADDGVGYGGDAARHHDGLDDQRPPPQ